MLDIQDFNNQSEEEKSRYVDELLQALTELEEEYQWTQDIETKEKMLRISHNINDILTDNLIHK